MISLRKIKLSSLFLALTLLLSVIVIIEGSYIVMNNSTIQNSAHDLANIDIPILNKAHELKLSVVQVQQWLTDISATRARDGLNDGFDEAEKNAVLFKKLIGELAALDTVNADHHRAMLPVFNAYYEVGKKMAQSYIDEGPAGGNKMMSEFDAVAAKMGEDVDAFLSEVELRASSRLARQIALDQSANQNIIMGSIFILLGIGAVYFVMSRTLSYLPKVLNEVNKISEGDLTSEIDISRQDEFGELMKGLRNMQLRLLDMITKIGSASQQLSTASEEVSAVMTQTAINIQQQQSDTEQIATAMHEMTAAVTNVSNNVSETSSASNGASDEVNHGKKVVQGAIAEIQQLANQIESTANVISQVEQSSEEINTVLEVIKGIAEQTNLLALNAAIEAARAGEQGRGFAVVADEVRTLAGRTQESTSEINQIIEKLQTGARVAAEAMTESQKQSHSVVEKAALAGSTLTAITVSVERIDTMNSQIEAAAEHQTIVAKSMDSNIHQINDLAMQNAASIEQTTVAGQELARVAFELRGLVEQFQVS